ISGPNPGDNPQAAFGGMTYNQALAIDHNAGANGIDKALSQFHLDAVVAPTDSPGWTTDLIMSDHFVFASSGLAGGPGYPIVQVPAANVLGMPMGISFLGHEPRAAIGAPRGAGCADRRNDLLPATAELAFAAQPLLDEAIATGARVRARPDRAVHDVWDLGEDRVVPIARDDRALVPVGVRRLRRRKEPGPEQNTVGAEHESRRDPRAVGNASGDNHRDLGNGADHHPREWQRRHHPDVPSAFGPLRNDRVRA